MAMLAANAESPNQGIGETYEPGKVPLCPGAASPLVIGSRVGRLTIVYILWS